MNIFNWLSLIEKKEEGLIILYIIKKFLGHEVPGTQRVLLAVLSIGAILPLFPPLKKKKDLSYSTESGFKFSKIPVSTYMFSVVMGTMSNI